MNNSRMNEYGADTVPGLYLLQVANLTKKRFVICIKSSLPSRLVICKDPVPIKTFNNHTVTL
jgi:hypothetical protein